MSRVPFDPMKSAAMRGAGSSKVSVRGPDVPPLEAHEERALIEAVAGESIKLYEAQGKLQLYVETLFPQGAGALELAFRQLCEKLRSEGLFEAGRKRLIPRVPQHVVIITSRTGDVLHDVLTTAWRRY